MKTNRRLKRMARARKNHSGLSLTSLMDVFTILVFFLLVNQSAVEVVEPPKEIKLPDSIVEAKPRQAIVMLVSNQTVMVQGKVVASIADVLAAKNDRLAPVVEVLLQIRRNSLGVAAGTGAAARDDEIIILADKAIPFKVLQKLMSVSAISGYTKISLGVVQKGTQKIVQDGPQG